MGDIFDESICSGITRTSEIGIALTISMQWSIQNLFDWDVFYISIYSCISRTYINWDVFHKSICSDIARTVSFTNQYAAVQPEPLRLGCLIRINMQQCIQNLFNWDVFYISICGCISRTFINWDVFHKSLCSDIARTVSFTNQYAAVQPEPLRLGCLIRINMQQCIQNLFDGMSFTYQYAAVHQEPI